MSAYELSLPPIWTGINKQNGRFLKGHVPANKGKKWGDYMGKRHFIGFELNNTTRPVIVYGTRNDNSHYSNSN